MRPAAGKADYQDPAFLVCNGSQYDTSPCVRCTCFFFPERGKRGNSNSNLPYAVYVRLNCPLVPSTQPLTWPPSTHEGGCYRWDQSDKALLACRDALYSFGFPQSSQPATEFRDESRRQSSEISPFFSIGTKGRWCRQCFQRLEWLKLQYLRRGCRMRLWAIDRFRSGIACCRS